jgi:hypothetical protein
MRKVGKWLEAKLEKIGICHFDEWNELKDLFFADKLVQGVKYH